MLLHYIKYLGVVCFIGFTTAAPPASKTIDDKFLINCDLFTNEFLVYTSEHDIVAMTVPLNAMKNAEFFNNYTVPLYFVEADINHKGQKDYKGLYSLKDGIVTKLLETGTDASASDDDNTQIYFSAKDGIYSFDAKTNKTEKYGTITDSLIGIVKMNGSEVLHVLTEEQYIYKVTDGGNKKEKLQGVEDAQQIVLDYLNNLYFYSRNKVPYVITTDGVKKINGLPENPTKVQLIKPSVEVRNGAMFTADDKVYYIYSNGTSELTDYILQIKPTSYALEATIIQYFSYNKKIYEFNIFKSLFGERLNDHLLDEMEGQIYHNAL